MIIILCLNYSDGLSVVEKKHIVGKLRLAASYNISSDIDPTICDFGLHRNVTFPPLENDRSDIIQLDIFF